MFYYIEEENGNITAIHSISYKISLKENQREITEKEYIEMMSKVKYIEPKGL